MSGSNVGDCIMQNSSADNVQAGTGSEPRQVVTDCMRTPVVLRLILRHFSNMELLKLSLVNKLWNNETRSILRNRKYLLAAVKSHHPCHQLKAFASDLQQMNVVPFSGMKIDLMSWCDEEISGCLTTLAGGLDPSYQILLDRLPWKYLSVRFHFNYQGAKKCPAFLLVKKILADFAGHLEIFYLNIERNRADFTQQVVQHCTFPSLKFLRLLDRSDTTSEEYTNLIRLLVSRAPILHGVYVQERVDLMKNLLEGSPAYLVANYEVAPSVHEIPVSVVNRFRIKRMKLREISVDLSLQRIKVITPVLLRVSCSLLTSMDIDAAFLAPLMYWEGICLNSVEDLQIHFSSTHPFRQRILRLVKQFDFARIFPSLTKVVCTAQAEPNDILQDQIMEIIEQGYPTLEEPVPNRAANITELRLCLAPGVVDCRAEWLPEMIPQIKTLIVRTFRGEIIPSLILEHHWANLKDLTIAKFGHSSSRNAHFDSVFCGIFPEEVAQLRKKGDKYLKNVNIVPVMPSFVCLKGLRSFTMHGNSAAFCRRDPISSETGYVPAEMLSRVTGLVAFKRCPALSVTLKPDDYSTARELDHMKPYASVVRGPSLIGQRGR